MLCTVFLYCKIWRVLLFVKFCGNSPPKGGLVHQKGGRSEGKRGSRQMYDTEGPYRVFLRYRLGKYRENTNRYHTEIPNRDTTLIFWSKCVFQVCYFWVRFSSLLLLGAFFKNCTKFNQQKLHGLYQITPAAVNN